MQRWRYVPIAVLLFQLVCIQSHASEKEPGRVGRKSLDCAEVSQALEGKTVRVRTQDQSKIEGRLVYCVSDTLNVANDSTNELVSFDDVTALWVRGNKSKGGLKIGAIIGGVLGGVLGGLALLAQGFCEYECDADAGPEYLMIGAALGAIPGALIGTGIGAISHRWNLWYASKAYNSDFLGQHQLDLLDNSYKGTSGLWPQLYCEHETKAVGLRVTIAF